MSSMISGTSVVAAAPVSTTSRAFVDLAGPTTSATTMISSRSRTKELECLLIEDQRFCQDLERCLIEHQRWPIKRISTGPGEPHCVLWILVNHLANWGEGILLRRSMAHDTSSDEVFAS